MNKLTNHTSHLKYLCQLYFEHVTNNNNSEYMNINSDISVVDKLHRNHIDYDKNYLILSNKRGFASII